MKTVGDLIEFILAACGAYYMFLSSMELIGKWVRARKIKREKEVGILIFKELEKACQQIDVGIRQRVADFNQKYQRISSQTTGNCYDTACKYNVADQCTIPWCEKK